LNAILHAQKTNTAMIVKRKAYPEVPPRVEYNLTKFGLQYTEEILALNLWVY